jgi:drug/metabolite transporter (DMT)-like permease
MDQYDNVLIFVTNFWFLLFVAYLGMLLHFFHKKIKGESIRAMKNYFFEHAKTVLSSVITTLIFFLAYYLALSTGEVADLVAVFGIGFMCDSYLNKYDDYKDSFLKKAFEGQTNVPQ